LAYLKVTKVVLLSTVALSSHVHADIFPFMNYNKVHGVY